MADIITKKKRILVITPRGSLYETRTWLDKARNRKLIAENDFQYFRENINLIGKMLNGYIKSIGNIKNKSDIIEKPEANYGFRYEDIFTKE